MLAVSTVGQQVRFSAVWSCGVLKVTLRSAEEADLQWEAENMARSLMCYRHYNTVIARDTGHLGRV